MRKIISICLGLITLCAIVIGCTKRIVLITNVDLDFAQTNTEVGFVNDLLPTTLTITPEAFLEEFVYTFSYEVVEGKGRFVTGANNDSIVSASEAIALSRLSDMDTNFILNLNYEPLTAGVHQVRVTAADNFEKSFSEILTYTVTEAPFLWEATSPRLQGVTKDTIPIQLRLENKLRNKELTYEMTIRLTKGTGVVLDAENNPVSFSKRIPLSEGRLNFNYVGTTTGSNTLQFELQTSDDTEKVATLTFNLEEGSTDKPPVANLDEATTPSTVPVTILALDNDTDPEGSTITLTDISSPTNGTASIETRTIIYTPNPSFIGKEILTYTIADATGNTAEGTIAITVTPREILTIADPNFEQALIDLDMGYDDVVDGQMFKDIAEKITTLDVSNKNISDLTGIEGFVNLESLIGHHNNLTEVNISTLTNLTALNLSNNIIVNIDLKNLLKLETLRLSRNKLRSLNTTYNLKLKNLYINSFDSKEFNLIPNLKVSHLSELEILECHGIDLVEIDLSKNLKLTTFQAGYNRRLKELDVSRNRNLKTLNPGISSIRELDVSNLTKLESLGLWQTKLNNLDVTKNSNLTFLAIAECAISEINLSGLTKLEGLWIVSTEIQDIDLSQNKSLKDLRLDKNKITRLNLRGLILEERLDITGNPNLLCVEVDNTTIANSNLKWEKDSTTSYSEVCP